MKKEEIAALLGALSVSVPFGAAVVVGGLIGVLAYKGLSKKEMKVDRNYIKNFIKELKEAVKDTETKNNLTEVTNALGLATKKDINARFDIVDKRLERFSIWMAKNAIIKEIEKNLGKDALTFENERMTGNLDKDKKLNLPKRFVEIDLLLLFNDKHILIVEIKAPLKYPGNKQRWENILNSYETEKSKKVYKEASNDNPIVFKFGNWKRLRRNKKEEYKALILKNYPKFSKHQFHYIMVGMDIINKEGAIASAKKLDITLLEVNYEGGFVKTLHTASSLKIL